MIWVQLEIEIFEIIAQFNDHNEHSYEFKERSYDIVGNILMQTHENRHKISFELLMGEMVSIAHTHIDISLSLGFV